jgi:hypothetical protein
LIVNSVGEVAIGSNVATDAQFKVYNNETGHNTILAHQDNASNGSYCVYVVNDGSAAGVYSSSVGQGVAGVSSGNYGGDFRSTASIGVYGHTTAANYGGYFHSDGNYGLYARTLSGSHGAFLGYDDGAACYGIIGYSPSTTLYTLYGNGSAYISGSYASSDSRLKDIQSRVTTSDGMLAKVNQLKPTYYKWKSNSDQGKSDSSEQIGFIAQEVEPIFSHVVKDAPVPDMHESPPDSEGNVETRDKTLNEELGDTKFIAYEKLTVYLTAALQELSAKNDALEARIKVLEDA